MFTSQCDLFLKKKKLTQETTGEEEAETEERTGALLNVITQLRQRAATRREHKQVLIAVRSSKDALFLHSKQVTGRQMLRTIACTAASVVDASAVVIVVGFEAARVALVIDECWRSLWAVIERRCTPLATH